MKIGKIRVAHKLLREDPEEQRRVIIISALTLITFVYCTVAAIQARTDDSGLVSWLIGGALINLAGFFFIMGTGHYRSASLFLLHTLSALLLYLVITGGRNGTGLLWVYLYYPVPMLCMGLRVGSAINAIFLAGIAFLLYGMGGHLVSYNYSDTFRSHFLASNMAMLLVAVIYEYARVSAYESMMRIRRKLDRISRTDELTGLPNRREIHQRLRYEAVRAARHLRSFSIVLGDLDGFKLINDTHGHLAGDKILREVARVLRSALRKEDSIGRWGGEEFLVLLPETSTEGAVRVAENLRKRVQEMQIEWHDRKIPVTISLGISFWEKGSLENLLRRADHNLYAAKRSGRNCVISEDDNTLTENISVIK